MIDVICDTSFLIHLATKKIKNLDSINVEIGEFQYVIPLVVLDELERLSKIPDKEQDIRKTLEFVRTLNTVPISGKVADNAITDHIKKHGVGWSPMLFDITTCVKSYLSYLDMY